MKCPIDQTEMEKGKLGARGTTSADMWLPTERKWYQALTGGPEIIAYKCPKCGKVELTSEVK